MLKSNLAIKPALPSETCRAIKIVSSLLTQFANDSICRTLHGRNVVTASRQFTPKHFTS